MYSFFEKDQSRFLLRIQFIFLWLLLASSVNATDRFVAITPERTGTHLLTRALTFLTTEKVINVWERRGNPIDIQAAFDAAKAERKYVQMHAFPEKYIVDLVKKNENKVVFLLRDPRDHLISVLYFIHERHWEYEQLRIDYPFGELTFEEQIEEMITGEKYGVSVPNEFIGKRLPWMHIPQLPAYTAHFENLVGEKGCGSKAAQIEELTNLSQFLNVDINQDRIESIADQLFGWEGLGTFRTGEIGTWKYYFTERHKELFKIYFGQELINLGYETDFNW